MKNFTFYFKSPSGFKDNLPRSDTLFGAICWGIKLFYGEQTLIDFLASYEQDNPPLIISSTFPCLNSSNDVIHFFPKPITKPRNIPTTVDDSQNTKKLKDVAFVCELLFQKFISFGHNYLDEYDNGEKLNFSNNEKFVSTKFVFFPKITLESIPGNTINRLTGGTLEGKLYNTTELFLSKHTEAYLLAKIGENWIDKIIAILRFFGDKGLGGDSSVGKGNYLLKVKEGFPIEELTTGNSWINLSLYYPKSSEWSYFQKNHEHAWYSIIKRRGKMEVSFQQTSSPWKKSLLMIEEGSTFPLIPNVSFYGENPVVKDRVNEFKVIQYGMSFSMKVKSND